MTTPTLLDVLLAGLRGQQGTERCYLCLTSDAPGDCCGEHLERLRRIAETTATSTLDHTPPTGLTYARRPGADLDRPGAGANPI